MHKVLLKSSNKQSSGVQERMNPFYINFYGKNSFGLRTFRFTNDLQERIKFVNRGLTVFDLLSVVFVFFVTDLMVSIDSVLRTCAQSTAVKV